MIEIFITQFSKIVFLKKQLFWLFLNNIFRFWINLTKKKQVAGAKIGNYIHKKLHYARAEIDNTDDATNLYQTRIFVQSRKGSQGVTN